jgi:hypothetical protein
LGAICSVELIIDHPNKFDDKYDVLSINSTEITFPYSSREACLITRDLYRYYVNIQNMDTFERSASYPLEFKLRPYACFLFNGHSYIIAGKEIGNMEKETVYRFILSFTFIDPLKLIMRVHQQKRIRSVLFNRRLL